MSDSLQPHEWQHARPPCPSPTPGVHPHLCPSSRWCHPAISSSVVSFSSCLQSLPASESFPRSQVFAWGGQNIGVLASVLPKKSQDWSPLEWTGWISLQSKGLSRVFSNTTVQKHQFFGTQLSSGEGNGNPLQYSCLENPMDGGAWWAAVHGVTRSWTRLKQLSSSSSSSSFLHSPTFTSIHHHWKNHQGFQIKSRVFILVTCFLNTFWTPILMFQPYKISKTFFQLLSSYLRISIFLEGLKGASVCFFPLRCQVVKLSSCHCFVSAVISSCIFLKNIYILSSFRSILTLFSNCVCVCFFFNLFKRSPLYQVGQRYSLFEQWVNKTLQYYFTKRKMTFFFCILFW